MEMKTMTEREFADIHMGTHAMVSYVEPVEFWGNSPLPEPGTPESLMWIASWDAGLQWHNQQL